MKKLTLILFLSMVLIFSAEAHKNRNTYSTISIQTFYDQLSPYGDWIYSPDYGYVWRPYFDRPESFRPYSSNGNWVYTDYGWTWASGYEWGWAAFHYGRWDFDNYLGWLWIPGYEWAPAWVSWGSYNNYWGWAPLGPNIYAQANSNWYAPDPWWTFVPQNQFCSTNWNRYIYDRPIHVTNITHITNIYVDGNNHNNHNSWYNGPRVNDVEKYSRSRVIRMEVGESQRPDRTGIHNNRLDVYRPTVENKREEYRPTQYRNVEQARTGRRIEQTNARTNDPGVNRTRENSSGTRAITPKPAQRNENTGRDSRVEPRTSTEAPNSRTSDNTRNSRETPRNTAQPEKRNGSTNKETGIDTRNASQSLPSRNSTQRSVEPQGDNPDRRSSINVTEGNRPIGNTGRVVNTETNQPRNTTPVRENVNINTTRETGTRQSTSTQPTREQRTQVSTPAPATRTGSSERVNTTKEEVKKDHNNKPAENSERRATGSPKRR